MAKCRRRILGDLWPQIPPEENPITSITNGVHVPTFLSPEWADVFDHFLGYGWSQRLGDQSCWDQISEVPDHVFWSTRQHLKSQLLHLVRYRLREQNARNQGSEAHLDRLLRLCNPDNPTVLIIGFGRRFATYKRAALLFENLDWLRQVARRPAAPGAVPVRRQGASGRRARAGSDPAGDAGGANAGIRGQDTAGRRL